MPRLKWKLPFHTHCNLLYTIDKCYLIEFKLEKRCAKTIDSCLSSDDNFIFNNYAKSCDNRSIFLTMSRHISHKYSLVSTK